MGGRILFRYVWKDDERNAYLYPFDILSSAQAHEFGEFGAEEPLGGQELRRLVRRCPMTRGDGIFQARYIIKSTFDDGIISVSVIIEKRKQ